MSGEIVVRRAVPMVMAQWMLPSESSDTGRSQKIKCAGDKALTGCFETAVQENAIAWIGDHSGKAILRQNPFLGALLELLTKSQQLIASQSHLLVYIGAMNTRLTVFSKLP